MPSTDPTSQAPRRARRSPRQRAVIAVGALAIGTTVLVGCRWRPGDACTGQFTSRSTGALVRDTAAMNNVLERHGFEKPFSDNPAAVEYLRTSEFRAEFAVEQEAIKDQYVWHEGDITDDGDLVCVNGYFAYTWNVLFFVTNTTSTTPPATTSTPSTAATTTSTTEATTTTTTTVFTPPPPSPLPSFPDPSIPG